QPGQGVEGADHAEAAGDAADPERGAAQDEDSLALGARHDGDEHEHQGGAEAGDDLPGTGRLESVGQLAHGGEEEARLDHAAVRRGGVAWHGWTAPGWWDHQRVIVASRPWCR